MDQEEIDLIKRQFKRHTGEGKQYSLVSNEVIERYKGQVMCDKDKFDIITYIWEEFGLCSYMDGLFSFVNPEEYNGIAKLFPEITENVIVFGRSACGGLFALDTPSIGECIIYINPHKGTWEVIDTSMEILLTFFIDDNDYWKDGCYGKVELKVIKKHGPLEHDECYTFVPALALGGSESVATMEKVKIKENLELLAQLHQG